MSDFNIFQMKFYNDLRFFFQYKNAITLDLGDYKKGRFKHELYKNDGFD